MNGLKTRGRTQAVTANQLKHACYPGHEWYQCSVSMCVSTKKETIKSHLKACGRLISNSFSGISWNHTTLGLADNSESWASMLVDTGWEGPWLFEDRPWDDKWLQSASFTDFSIMRIILFSCWHWMMTWHNHCMGKIWEWKLCLNT